jgi:hypothetical protein
VPVVAVCWRYLRHLEAVNQPVVIVDYPLEVACLREMDYHDLGCQLKLDQLEKRCFLKLRKVHYVSYLIQQPEALQEVVNSCWAVPVHFLDHLLVAQ